MKFLLIDTSNYAYKFFSAVGKDSCNELFLNMLKKAIKYFQVDAYCCCLDSEKSFRYDIYSEYKANRPKKPVEYDESYKELLKLFEQFKIHHINSKKLEAEDSINLMIKNHPTTEFYVLSGDKDCLLLNKYDNCLGIWDYKIGSFEERKYVKYNIFDKDKKICAEKMLMYLVLKGDVSDNIPGIPKIGEQKIQKIMEIYPSLEILKKKLEKPTIFDLANKEFQIIQQNKEKLLLSEKLVMLFEAEWVTELSKYSIKKNK